MIVAGCWQTTSRSGNYGVDAAETAAAVVAMLPLMAIKDEDKIPPRLFVISVS
jgi:hypothetical protein